MGFMRGFNERSASVIKAPDNYLLGAGNSSLKPSNCLVLILDLEFVYFPFFFLSRMKSIPCTRDRSEQGRNYSLHAVKKLK